MKVYNGFSNYSAVKNAVVTIGTFDGVHIGHQTIINRLVGIAKKHEGETVLVTFHPHPRIVLQKNANVELLTSIRERINLLEKSGIDHLIIIPFDEHFAKLNSLEFIRDVLVEKIGTKRLVIGYDHHFGRNREGSFKHLIKYGPIYGFEVEEIPAQEVNDINAQVQSITPRPGTLVLFPSYLEHKVNPNLSNEERIVISFNVSLLRKKDLL